MFVCCGASGCGGAVVWMEMQSVLEWGVCFFVIDYLFVIVGDCFSGVPPCGKRGKFLETVLFYTKMFQKPAT